MDKNINLEKRLDEIITNNLIILQDRDNAIEVLETFNENGIGLDCINSYPEVLNVKSSKVVNIINAFKENEIPLEILEKNPYVIEKTNATRIANNIKLCRKEELSPNVIEKFPEILAYGNHDDMKKVFKIFDSRIINKRFFLNAGDVLAFSVPSELEKIMKILDEEDLLNLVLKKEPKALYANKSKVVKDIIELFKNPKEKLGLNLIKNDPKLLSEVTKVRISAILNLLDRMGISRTAVKNNPEILYSNETKDIENIIGTLKDKGIKKREIAEISEILAYKDLSENLEIIDFLKDNTKIFKNIIEKQPKVITKGNIDNLKEFKEKINQGLIDNQIIIDNPELVIKNTAENIIKIIENLNKIGLPDYHKNNQTILYLQDPEKIIKIKELFEELGLSPEIYKKSVTIFTEADIDNIRNIVEEIDVKGLDRDILQNSFVLVRGNPKNITKIIEKFEKSDKENLGTDILKRSGTILAQGDVNKIDDITKFLEEKGLLNANINIPASIYAKGNPEQMQEVYSYMEKIGLLEGLKSSMTLFIRSIDNIKANVNLLIENGLFDDFKNNVSILGLPTESVEQRINYLQKIGKPLTIPLLKMNNKEFYQMFGITDDDMMGLKKKSVAQVLIDNKYAEYVSNAVKFLDLKKQNQVKQIFDEIKILGRVNSDLEYFKRGYYYSLLKIESNLEKIVSKLEDFEHISFLEKNKIMVMAILGNKRVTKKEVEDIIESVDNREIEILDFEEEKPKKEENKDEDEIENKTEDIVEDKEDDEDLDIFSKSFLVAKNQESNLNKVDGVSIDDIDDIDDFDKIAGIKENVKEKINSEKRIEEQEQEKENITDEIENEEHEDELDNKYIDISTITGYDIREQEKEEISNMKEQLEKMNLLLSTMIESQKQEKQEQIENEKKEREIIKDKLRELYLQLESEKKAKEKIKEQLKEMSKIKEENSKKTTPEKTKTENENKLIDINAEIRKILLKQNNIEIREEEEQKEEAEKKQEAKEREEKKEQKIETSKLQEQADEIVILSNDSIKEKFAKKEEERKQEENEEHEEHLEEPPLIEIEKEDREDKDTKAITTKAIPDLDLGIDKEKIKEKHKFFEDLKNAKIETIKMDEVQLDGQEVVDNIIKEQELNKELEEKFKQLEELKNRVEQKKKEEEELRKKEELEEKQREQERIAKEEKAKQELLAKMKKEEELKKKKELEEKERQREQERIRLEKERQEEELRKRKELEEIKIAELAKKKEQELKAKAEAEAEAKAKAEKEVKEDKKVSEEEIDEIEKTFALKDFTAFLKYMDSEDTEEMQERLNTIFKQQKLQGKNDKI